ncbi:MAG: Crp/Fnr family transcriptional regulator [Rickettsiales bacterium]|nr:Crp/Fnr family transcriptional regulator [Rickettsiales bacterium]
MNIALSSASETPRHSPQSILESTQLFSKLDTKTKELFAQKGILHQHPKGKILFMHEDPAEWFYIIADGWVKLFRETLDGKEAVVDVLTTGHIFGETAIFEQDTYTYSTEVVEDATLLALPLSLLQEEIERNGALAMSMFSAMSRFRRQQDTDLEHMALQNAPQRIGCFLLRLIKPGEKGPVTLHLPYDKTLLAMRLGMKPETFSRALARLREDINIQVHGATMKIDSTDRLVQYCCNACSSTYPCKDLS